MPEQIEYIQSCNNCPDCLYMELKAFPIQKDRKLFASFGRQVSESIDELKLLLNILFNEQWVDVPMGRVKFGISGGELKLKLKNCKVPFASRSLCSDLELSVAKNRQQKKINSNKNSINAEVSSPNLKAEFSESTTNEETDSFHFTACQVTTKGEPTSPSWVFESKTGEPVLKGRLAEAILGTLTGINASDEPWYIEAIFEITVKDVKITDSQGAWFVNLVPNRRAVVDRYLAELILKKKIKPYISRVELKYV